MHAAPKNGPCGTADNQVRSGPPASRAASSLLSMPCAVEHIAATAATARKFLLEQQLSTAEADACELALVEACNNAVLYAPPERRQEAIGIQIIASRDMVEFQISDHTAGFDWQGGVSLPPADEAHGRGLFIIRSLMDEVMYLRGSFENRLVLRKKRAGESSNAPHDP